MLRAKLRKLDRTLRAHLKEQQQQQQVAPPKQDYLDKDCHKTYSCIHCRAHLAKHDELISKLFQGNHGRAYLFNKVVNIGCKQAVERELLTGLHAVADIFCHSCNTTLGWKYEQAFVASQKYKEGKYIIELVHLLKENDWDAGSAQCADSIALEQLASSAPASACRVAPEPRAGLNACARHVLSAQKKVRNQKVWPQEALPGRVELAPVCTTVARSSSSGRSPNQANQPSEQSASASPTSSASPSNQESERERISEIDPTKQTAHRARLESSDVSSLGGKLVALSAAPVRGSSD